nr:MAG: hypothetical protein [Chemarfal virus 270]
MRSYGKYSAAKPRTGERKRYAERQSNEWDVRLDVTQESLTKVKSTLNANRLIFKYCLVSGIEHPDPVAFRYDNMTNGSKHIKNGSEQNHVHLALITNFIMKREQLLQFVRGLTPLGEEYACPRNKKYTYAGWWMHHTKTDTKLIPAEQVELEYGDLPLDDVNHVTSKEVLRMYNKYGSPLAKNKFQPWLEYKEYEYGEPKPLHSVLSNINNLPSAFANGFVKPE